LKTDQLIAALVADRAAPRQSLARRLLFALVLGGLLSLGLFLAFLRPRADFGPALTTWRFDFKILLMIFIAVLAFEHCRTMAKPLALAHTGRRLLIPLAAIVAALGVELLTVPQTLWEPRLIGSNSLICMSAIPLLSLAPMMAILSALRGGAPASPMLTGASAGLLAAACGAALYALHCFDDSPLFVATWYTLAAFPVVIIGAVAGHRLLRW
jgi:hypothetical protein